MQKPPSFSDWSSRHAGICALAGGVSVAVSNPAPLALAGGLSLLAFLGAFRPDQARLGGLGVANAVTLGRLALLVAAAVVAPSPWTYGLVLLLDGLDGALARRLGEASDFGAHFDMETDALLVATLSVASLVAGAPPWVLGLGAMRYALVLTRVAFPVEVQRERRSRFGRLVFVGAVGALLASLWPPLAPVRPLVLAVALGAMATSFFPDFAGLRRA